VDLATPRMSQRQSNEDAQQYVRWNPSGAACRIELNLELVPRLISEIAAAESLGIEIGGALIGTFTDSPTPVVRIEECELVPRNADNSPAYMLDPGQRQYLTGLRVGASARGRSAIGFFRSHLRPGPLRPSLADRSFLVGQFKEPIYVVLLVEAREPRMGAFFVALNGQLSTEPAVQEFRFGERALRSAREIRPDIASERYKSGSERKSAKSGTASGFRRYGILAFLAIAGAGIFLWPLLSGMLSSLNRLDLAVIGNDHTLKISWNHGSTELSRATDASLVIADGTTRRAVQLGRDELQWGVVEYEPGSRQIHVTLTLNRPGSSSLTESADWQANP